MKKIMATILTLSACAAPIVVPQEFKYKEIQTPYFKLATWQKITGGDYFKVYIEGDGNSFTSRGFPTEDPTPRGTFLRQLTFDDKDNNVLYVARPCQFVEDTACQEKFWTTARFAPEVINSIAYAISSIVGDKEVYLSGFSGGAQVAGLVAVLHPEIKVKRIDNYAPNLDHTVWTNKLHLLPLEESMDLRKYQDEYLMFNQMNYIPEDDRVIIPEITINFLMNDPSKYTIIKDKAHNFR